MDAGLLHGRIEDEFGLAVFLLDCVVAVYGELTERLAVCGDAVAQDNVVCGVADQRDTQDGREPDQDQSLQKVLDSISKRGAHGGQL